MQHTFIGVLQSLTGARSVSKPSSLPCQRSGSPLQPARAIPSVCLMCEEKETEAMEAPKRCETVLYDCQGGVTGDVGAPH